MNFSQLKTLVAQWADDPEFGYFGVTLVSTFLNNAQREAQKRLIQAGENWYIKCVSATMVVNQPCYALPLDFLKLHRIEAIQSGLFPNETKIDLVPITIGQQQLYEIQPTLPRCFYLKKNNIYFVPPPDQAYGMRLTYSYRVGDMSLDTDVPDVPEEFHEYLAILAAYDCRLKDDRVAQEVLTKKAMYEDLFRQNAEQRQQAQPREVVTTEDMGWGDWV